MPIVSTMSSTNAPGRACMRMTLMTGKAHAPLSEGYLPALDGMRALAIALVLIFHVNDSYLPGGFVGVDLFFVISGFIITRSILTARGKGGFSILDFYRRRYSRLLPASMATIALTLIAVWLTQGPALLEDTARAALFAATSTANIFFNFQAGYFDDTSAVNPLLHMWSLSVEEQFYLVWPLALLALPASRNRGALALIGFTLVAAAISIWVWSQAPATMFYQAPFRAFQFAAGAALAVYGRSLQGWSAGLAALAGCALLAFAAMGAGEPYGIWRSALAPTLAAGLLIAGIQSRPVQSVFAFAPVAALGKRAYSIYLVHWPIMVLAGLSWGQAKEPLGEAVLLAASLTAGELLYRFVESPLRIRPVHDAASIGRRAWATSFALVGVLIMIAGAVTLPSQMSEPRAATMDISSDRVREHNQISLMAANAFGGCFLAHGETLNAYDPTCLTADPSRTSILLMGDSFAVGSTVMLKSAWRDADLRVAIAAGCAPFAPGSPSHEGACAEIYSAWHVAAQSDEFSAVAIATAWHGWTPDEINEALAALAALDKPVLVFGVRQALSEPLPVLLQSPRGSELVKDLRPAWGVRADRLNARLAEAVESAGGSLIFLDTLRVFCPDACPAFTPTGQPMIYDTGHLTVEGAIWASDSLRRDPAFRQFRRAVLQTHRE